MLERRVDLRAIAYVARDDARTDRRARMTTSQPSSRNRFAAAAPMPLVPPVMTTRLPANPSTCSSFGRARWGNTMPP